MTFEGMLRLCPETQSVTVILAGDMISGNADALHAYLNITALECKVINIEAEGGTLKVWVEDNEE